MNKLDEEAYKQALTAIFAQVKESYPQFQVGKTLNGIIADWSDTQLKGLQAAVGVEVLTESSKDARYEQGITSFSVI